MNAPSKPGPLLVWLDLETGGLKPAQSAILDISYLVNYLDGYRRIG